MSMFTCKTLVSISYQILNAKSSERNELWEWKEQQSIIIIQNKGKAHMYRVQLISIYLFVSFKYVICVSFYGLSRFRSKFPVCYFWWQTEKCLKRQARCCVHWFELYTQIGRVHTTCWWLSFSSSVLFCVVLFSIKQSTTTTTATTTMLTTTTIATASTKKRSTGYCFCVSTTSYFHGSMHFPSYWMLLTHTHTQAQHFNAFEMQNICLSVNNNNNEKNELNQMCGNVVGSVFLK